MRWNVGYESVCLYAGKKRGRRASGGWRQRRYPQGEG